MARRLLIIDDDWAILELTTHILSHSYEVQVAPSPLGWESKLETFNPDFILLDLMLPDMNGVDFCKVLRAHPKYRAIPVMVLSAASREMIMQAMRAGATRFLAKPFDPKVLRMVIDDLLEQSPRLGLK